MRLCTTFLRIQFNNASYPITTVTNKRTIYQVKESLPEHVVVHPVLYLVLHYAKSNSFHRACRSCLPKHVFSCAYKLVQKFFTQCPVPNLLYVGVDEQPDRFLSNQQW